MLCCEGSHITHENRNFKTSLVCLLPVHHIIWNNFGGKSNRQQQKNYIIKRNIRIMAATKRRASCRKLFKKFNILSLASEFLLSLLLSFVVDNSKFQTNSYIHSISTRYRCNLHDPNTSLNTYKKEFTILELSYSVILHLM
jgi:hypothetical protein